MNPHSPVASPRVPEQEYEHREPAHTPPTPFAMLHLNSTHATPNAALKLACAPHRDAAADKENARDDDDACVVVAAAAATTTPTTVKRTASRGVAFVSDGLSRLDIDDIDATDDIDDDDEDEDDGTRDDNCDGFTPRVVRGASAVLYDIKFAIEKDTKPLAARLAEIRRSNASELREMFALAFGKPTSGKNVEWLRRCLRMRFRAIEARARGATVKFTSTKASATFVVVHEDKDKDKGANAPLKARKRKAMRDDDDDDVDDNDENTANAMLVGSLVKHTWLACPFASKNSSAPRSSDLPECANCRALSLLFEPDVPPMP